MEYTIKRIDQKSVYIYIYVCMYRDVYEGNYKGLRSSERYKDQEAQNIRNTLKKHGAHETLNIQY